MDNICIYSPEGVLLHEAPMSRQNRIVNQLMGEHYIEIAFNVASSISFVAGSYIVYNGWHYFLKKDAYPEPISGVAGYKYVLKFYAPQHHLERCICKWNIGGNQEVSFTLTTTLDEFAKLLVDNMTAFQSHTTTGFRWTYVKSNRIDTREVTFDGISCWEAMQRITEAFGVEYWVQYAKSVTSVSELTIHFGKCLSGEYADIREGEVVTRFPASKRGEDSNYGTRFYIYGSAKNIPDDYYENVTGGVTNHISEKRLHLPNGQAYIDILNGEIVDTLPEGRIIERTITIDNIYPKNTSTVSAVEERKETIIEGREDYAYSISSTDSGFSGADEDVLSTLGITFTSGALSGSSFDVRWNKPFENKFHIQPRVEGTSGSEQIVMPNEWLKPAVGDTFVLTGIRLPETKVAEAEQELLTQGVAKAKEYGSDTNVYDCKTNPVYCQRNKVSYHIGRRVKLLGGAFGEAGRMSRIQGFEKALWNEYDATYNIGDNATYSRVVAIAKGYANDSGRVVREESTKWQNKMNVSIQSAAGNADILKAVYPVGAVYISTVGTNPSTLFGFGTWTRIKDTFLLGAGDSYSAGSTGGEAEHTLTTDEMPSHKHTVTTAEAGEHTHTIGNDQDVTYNASGKCRSVHKAETGAAYYDGSTGKSGAHTHTMTVNNTGGGDAHNNMPPYLAVYVWKRTA